ncbi:PREDICTED: protein FAM32A-like [Theobroma cacao]|uniref:Protein FAM32A-like n=1 Tax=Theobroma cacao TaxID=3641 RepID=A0AB32UN73_THECC|nr:PREDICTED: protein FAM32A-like [Theobroma cacao]
MDSGNASFVSRTCGTVGCCGGRKQPLQRRESGNDAKIVLNTDRRYFQMSAYENFVGGRLRLKGKPLHVKADGISKNKKNRHKHRIAFHSQGEKTGLSTDQTEEVIYETEQDGSEAHAFEDHLTPAERKFLEQTHKLELQRLAKMASKSHRDRIQEFNQYLANLTEHYDIPKVGPG